MSTLYFCIGFLRLSSVGAWGQARQIGLLHILRSLQIVPPLHSFEPTISFELPVTRHRAQDRSPSLQAYPNLTAAAEILGVSASTLSRRGDLATEHRGERDIVIAPADVLRLAVIYRKRSLNDVAQALLDHAR